MQLRNIRIDKKLSIPALSRLSSVPVRTIEEIERRDACSVATAKKLAKTLAVTLDELCADALYREEENSAES